MPRRRRGGPGKVAFIVLLLVLAVLAVFDLSSPNSKLKATWQGLFPGESQGEELRDGVLDVITPRR